MSGLRDAFDEIVTDVPVYGDLDQAIEQADRERRRRYGVVGGLVAAAAGVAAIAGLLVANDDDTAPKPVGPALTPTPSPTEEHEPDEKDPATDLVQRNGQITSLERRLGTEAHGYAWRDYDPMTDTGLYVTPDVPEQTNGVDGLEVVGPTGLVATLTCARDLECPSGETWLNLAATLGPGADEVTVVAGDGTAQVLGLDGTSNRVIDLGAATTDEEEVRSLRWSPDGTRLAVVTAGRPDGRDATRMWLVDPEDGDAQLAYSLLSDFTRPRTRAGPEFDGEGGIWTAGDWGWSPDGRTLLLDVYTGAYRADVVLLHLRPDGAADPVVAQTLYHSDRFFDWWGNVAWSPDGTRIAVRTSEHITEISAEDGSVIAQHPRTNGWVIWPLRGS